MTGGKQLFKTLPVTSIQFNFEKIGTGQKASAGIPSPEEKRTPMKAIKSLRSAAWNYEFDLIDSEEQARLHQLERMRRSAMQRGSTTQELTAKLPSPRSQDIFARTTPPESDIPDLSRHARTRLKQRGITMEQVVAVVKFGTEQRSHGASRYFLDKEARQLLAVEMRSNARSIRRMDIHVVLSDENTVITVAHRTRQLRRDIQCPIKRDKTH